MRHWLTGLLFCAWSAVVATAAPTVTVTSPTRNVLAPGQSVNLSVSATGSGTVTYQWLRKGKAIVGATSTTLAITNSSSADSGWYLVDATDGSGNTRSVPFFVSVAPARIQLLGWGVNEYGQTTIPAGLTNVLAAAAGMEHMIVLLRDGTVRAWGQNYYGQTDVPVGLLDVVAIAAGEKHSLALKSDGTVVAWGAGPSSHSSAADVPVGLSGVVAIATVGSDSLALKNDGTVVSWGDRTSENPVPSGLADVIGVSAGASHSMAIKQNGTLVGWGAASYGPLDIPAGLGSVRAAAGGWFYSIALRNDGSVTGWSIGTGNEFGQVNIPSGLSNVTDIAAGYYHVLALKNDGTVAAWGDNSSGQTSIPAGTNKILAVSAGGRFSYMLRDASDDDSPIIVTQPVGLTVPESDTTNFAVVAAGNGPFSYQWRRNGINVPGATSATLVLEETLLSDAGSYDVVVSNHVGSTASAAVTLAVNPVPVISALSPARQVIDPGAALQLSVTASGNGPLGFQWIHDGRILAGANTNTISVSSAAATDGGWYRVLITDSYGTRRSPLMFVVVAPAITEIRVWGDSSLGQTLVPPGLNDAVTLSSGYFPFYNGRWYAVRRNGTVAGWGEKMAGDFSVPAGLAGVVSVASGSDYVLALKSDGTVAGWGTANSPLANIPAGLHDVVAIAVTSHVLALKSNGTVVAWGYDSLGQTIVPSGLAEVVAVAAGSSHSMALKANGSVVAWGYNGGKQIEVPVDLANVVSIAAGSSHSMALKSDGTVVSWGGYGYYGRPVPLGLVNASAISAGDRHSIAIVGDGTVVVWGLNNSLNPAEAQPNLGGVLSVVAGGFTSIALVDPARKTIPVVIGQPQGLSRVEGESAVFRVNLYGEAPLAYQWRRNGISVPGATSSALHIAYVVPSDSGDYDVLITNSIGSVTSSPASLSVGQLPVISAMSSTRQVLVPGQRLEFSVTASGTGALSYQWMHNGRVIAGAANANYSVGAATLQNSGWYVVLITDDNGIRRSAPMFVMVAPENTRVRAWGGGGGFSYNGDQVPDGLSGVVKIAAGPHHSLALKRDGTVVAWGYNADGQSTVPAGLSDVVELTSHFGIGGYGYSLALKSNGTLVQWGGGSEPPAGLTDVVSIAAGSSHVLALKSDGTVVSWANGYGDSASNLPPLGLKNVVAIAAGYNRSIALKGDGTVVTWGESSSGEIGMPIGLKNIVSVAAGSAHRLALKSDGTVVAWGFNDSGQLDVPPSLANVVAISASASYSIALKADGTVVEWGNNGQTMPPADLDNVMAVSAGYYFSLALQYAPIFTSSPADSVHFEKETASFAAALYGSGLSTYQWQRNGVNVVGATNSSLTLSHLLLADAGNYTVVATNSVGSTTSTAGSLVVFVSPAAKAVVNGQSAGFAVVASGATDSTYQWQRLVAGSGTWGDLSNSGVFSGTTTATLLVNPATLAMNSDQFRCVVTGSAGTITSEAAALTVAPVRPATFDGQGYINRYPDLLAAYGALSDRLDLAWIHYYTAGIFAGRSDGDFDPAAYLAQYPELQATLGNNPQAAALHWYNTGRKEGRRIPAGFDLNSYLTRYPDITALFGADLYGAWLYYHEVGIYDGEVFDDLFRVEEYLALYPDLFAIFGSDLGGALDHWLSTGRIEGKLGRIPLEFKAQGYFDRNPDVATAVGNDPILAWGHYWLYGIYEGRAYDDELRVFEYLAINADLTAAFVNDWRQAALHWMRYGRTEGRLGRLPLTFNVTEYLVRSPDVAAVWGTNPTTVFLHFWAYGIDESRTYDDLFRPNEYLAQNPDLAVALGTDRRKAFKHWVRYGQTEGRPGRNP